jgi:hypothetical protein
MTTDRRIMAFNQWMTELLIEGNPAFFSFIFVIRRWLLQFCLSGFYEPTEIIHTAYLRGINYLLKDKENAIANYGPWMRATCLNIIRELSRDVQAYTSIEPEVLLLIDFVHTPNSEVEFEEMVEHLQKAIQILRSRDPKAADLLEWRYFQNLPWENIQERLREMSDSEDISLANLRQRGVRARRKLRKIYHDICSLA